MADANQAAYRASLVDRYQRLIDLSTDLASTLDLRALLSRIVKAAADLSQAEAASILLYDEQNQQLFFEAATNLEEPLMRGLVVPAENSIAGWIVAHCEPVIISDVKDDPRHYSGVAQATHVETTSLLAVPLCAKGKVVGVLEAINKAFGSFAQFKEKFTAAATTRSKTRGSTRCRRRSRACPVSACPRGRAPRACRSACRS